MAHGAVDVLTHGLSGGEEASTEGCAKGNAHGEIRLGARLEATTGAGAVGAASIFGGHDFTFRRNNFILYYGPAEGNVARGLQ